MDSQWLKIQFQHNPDKTKAALARALNLEPPAISKILAGMRQIKAHEYIKMRTFFGLSDEQKTPPSNKSSYVLEPLYNLSENQKQTGEWSIPASILGEKTSAAPEQIKIFLIEETLMEPTFKKGEHVVVDLSDKNLEKAGNFVLSDSHSYMARQCELAKQPSKGKIRVSALQKNFEPQVLSISDIHIIGRIIGKMQWI